MSYFKNKLRHPQRRQLTREPVSLRGISCGIVVNFLPSFSPQVFLFVSSKRDIFITPHLWHLFVTGFVKNTLTSVYGRLSLNGHLYKTDS